MDSIFIDMRFWAFMGWQNHQFFEKWYPMYVIGAKTPATDNNQPRYLYLLRIDNKGYYTFFKTELKEQYTVGDIDSPDINTILCSSDPSDLYHMMNTIDFDCHKAFKEDCKPPICSESNKLPCQHMSIMKLTPIFVM